MEELFKIVFVFRREIFKMGKFFMFEGSGD